MTQSKANRRSQDEWLQLIQECRSSGLTDRTWCEQHGILVSSFYNAVKRLTMKQKLSSSQKSANYPYQTFDRLF